VVLSNGNHIQHRVYNRIKHWLCDVAAVLVLGTGIARNKQYYPTWHHSNRT